MPPPATRARSVVVEACAGAGKTWMLVSRILRALLDGAAAAGDPGHHLHAQGRRRDARRGWTSGCTSFAAPRDRRRRGRAANCASAASTAGQARALAPALAGLHERLLAAGRAVEMRTFHAWFAQLLRAAPLELLAELGLRPDMRTAARTSTSTAPS